VRSRSPWRLRHNTADKITHCPHCAAPDLAKAHSSPFARFEVLDGWISALFKDRVDPLHDEVMDFAALMEGGLTQRFVDRSG